MTSISGEPGGEVTPDFLVRDNADKHRYEILKSEKVIGVIAYRRTPEVLALVHTEVVPEMEGHGVGERLVEGALRDIRSRGLKIAPVCSFVAAYLEKHPDQGDLVAPPPPT